MSQGHPIPCQAAIAWADGDEIATRPFQWATDCIWRGSTFKDTKGRSELPKYVERRPNGQCPLHDFITHTMDLSSIYKTFERLHQNQRIRSMILFPALVEYQA
ncbi:hypothetical protein [Celerinatantimonas sp. YJH-8]|uniref:hypothetical protein n=1 Tax=Celerinatantimonas sp. YJH-8 TaxID=3228714 RepID=UPI0038C292B8